MDILILVRNTALQHGALRHNDYFQHSHREGADYGEKGGQGLEQHQGNAEEEDFPSI
jgi:hypothetical protein